MLIDPDGPLIYIIIFVLLLLSSIFAGSESAYASCNKHRLIVLSEDGSKRAKVALKILKNFDTSLITNLITINVCHVFLSVISTILFVTVIGSALGSVISTIITTIVVFLFAEILPKNIATSRPDEWALFFAHFNYFFIVILFPLSLIFSFILKGTKKTFNLEEDEDEFDDEDFTDVIEKVEDEGMLDEEESDIILSAMEFGDIRVKEVYTKKENIVAIDIKDLNTAYLDDFLLKYTYTRFPVYDRSLDNIVGILHVRTYLKQRLLNKIVNIKDILQKPFFVKPSSKIDDIFEYLKKNKTQLAIVKSKEEVIGMVTMKDILEELIEDIDDKADSSRRNK